MINKFSFAYRGKDGVAFPMDGNTFDSSITFLNEAIENEKYLGLKKVQR